MSMHITEITNKKQSGSFYTPQFLVDNILDMSGYYGQTILKKHVIDNSCGDGAFLAEIVKRYCIEYLKNKSDLNILANELAFFIHGIEINPIACSNCIENLNCTVNSFGINYIDWDILCADALSVDKFNGKMDFVLGNPPYVRIHNLSDTLHKNIKNFTFAKSGMTDLYIVFYEIGIKMLNKYGILGYITPNSFFNSIAGNYLRGYLVKFNLIDKIIDLKHFQAFNATTYTTIVILKNNRTIRNVDYYQFDSKNNFPYYIDTLTESDYYINNNFYFASIDKLSNLKFILNFKTEHSNFNVKNGFATLADNFFIGNFDFDEYTIPIIKASTGKQYKCIFPYSKGKLIPYQDLTSINSIKTYFESNREYLMNRSLDDSKCWYGFGRTQGICDVYKNKYAINTLLKSEADLKLTKCDKGVGVYSGLYIVTNINENILHDLLYRNEFISYISLLGKYKNGGYYTFSSKELQNYLEFTYSQRRIINDGQYSIFSNT